MTTIKCTVCGKPVEDTSRFPTLTKQSACSLKCCELATEIHILETRLNNLKHEAKDRRMNQALIKALKGHDNE